MRRPAVANLGAALFAAAALAAWALMIPGSREARCAGRDDGPAAAEGKKAGRSVGTAESSGTRLEEERAGVKEAHFWSSLAGEAEYRSFAIEGSTSSWSSVTWPLRGGPVKVSLGASAATGTRVRAGPYLLVEVRF